MHLHQLSVEYAQGPPAREKTVSTKTWDYDDDDSGDGSDVRFHVTLFVARSAKPSQPEASHILSCSVRVSHRYPTACSQNGPSVPLGLAAHSAYVFLYIPQRGGGRKDKPKSFVSLFV